MRDSQPAAEGRGNGGAARHDPDQQAAAFGEGNTLWRNAGPMALIDNPDRRADGAGFRVIPT
jgi:hypothetical protein